MKAKLWPVFRLLFIGALMLVIGGGFLFALERLDEGRQYESKDQLERSLRRAIAVSYAIDGAYPESLDAIVETYGVQIDYDRFNVFYLPVAENLAPELDIIDTADVREGGASW